MPGSTSPATAVETDGSPIELVQPHLARVAETLRARGIAAPDPQGKLLRPVLAYAMVPPNRRAELDDRFWLGALAIQMVHEASLLHDDILDGARERRGTPTLNSSRGPEHALVLGDHYLTGAYRAALGTGSHEFLSRFVEAVERTVAGEVRQAGTAGESLDLADYFDIVLRKSGELLATSACLGAAVLPLDGIEGRAALGRQLGALYQQIDDLLDYCPAADTGKESLKDYRQRKWTWLLHIAGIESFELTDAQLMEAIFGRGPWGISTAERALRTLEIRREGLLRALAAIPADEVLVTQILDGWLAAARSAVEVQVEQISARGRFMPSALPTASSDEALVHEAARRVGPPEE